MSDKKNNTGIDNTGGNNSGDWNSGNRNSGDWNSGNRNSGNRNSGNRNSGDRNSGHRNSGNWNSGDWNSGNWNSGDWNSGDWNSGYGNSGDWNSGHRNSGYGNSTDRSSGIFNSEEAEVIMFNRPTGKKWAEIDHPHFNEFYICKWIPEDDMTGEEKKADANFFVRGGYLKTYGYKEAWSNFWRDTDEENRKKFLALPNFDSTVFFDITGIDVGKTTARETIKIGDLEFDKEEVESRLKDLKPIK